MKCESAMELLDAYCDNELDAATAVQVQEHLDSCQACGKALATTRAVRIAVGNPALYYQAPASLYRKHRQGFPWRMVGIAAAVMLAFGIFWAGVRQWGNMPLADVDSEAVLSAHLRSMQLDGHLLDVPSTNQHEVKPWFDGKLDFSPPVPNLDSRGFLLAGGRLEYIASRQAAAIVYRRAKHIINVFVQPGSCGEAEVDQQGYHLLEWNQGGMKVWAISDLNLEELRQFEQLFRGE